VNESTQTEKILHDASFKSDRELAAFSRLKYLNWSLESQDGINKVREVYESLKKTPPFAVDFFLKYVEIEKCASGSKMDLERIILSYEEALIHFEKEDIGRFFFTCNILFFIDF
jgi:hypothetical protein